MDFIIGLPMTTKKHDSIIVVVEKLTKSTYFVPAKPTHNMDDIAKFFMNEIFRLRGFPRAIILERDT